MPETAPRDTKEYPPERTELFDVILVRKEKQDWNAGPDDVKRVRVEGKSTLDARWHADVEKETDFRVADVVPADVVSPVESQALKRAQPEPTDRSKVLAK